MLKVLGDIAVGSGAITGASNTICRRAPLGVRLRVLLCIIGAVLDRLALLEVVSLAPLDGT